MRELLTTVASFAPNYWATLALGALCAYLGVFTVLRRIVFTGAALAQAAAAGVASSFFALTLPLPSFALNLLNSAGATLGSLGAAVGSALALARSERRGRVTADSMVGVVFAASSALAVLFVWRSSKGLVELKNILAGDVLLSSSSDMVSLWFGVVGVSVLHAFGRARFLLVAYDPAFARAQGLSVRTIERLFLISLAVAVALALRAAGLMLVFGTLVLPPLIGLRVAPTLGRATWAAVAAAWTSSLAGFLLATDLNLPIAPSIVGCQAVLFALAMLLPRVVGLVCVVGGVSALGVGASLGAFAPEPLPGPPVRGAPILREEAPQQPPPSAWGHGHAHGSMGSLERARDQRLARMADLSMPEHMRARAADELGQIGDPLALPALIEVMGDPSGVVASWARKAATEIATYSPSALEQVQQTAAGPDPELATHAARVLVELEHEGAWALLVERLADPAVPILLRDEVHLFLKAQNEGEGLGYEAFLDPAENVEAIAAWRAWAAER